MILQSDSFDIQRILYGSETTPRFPRHKIVINDLEIDESYDINYSEDLGELTTKGSLKLPFLNFTSEYDEQYWHESYIDIQTRKIKIDWSTNQIKKFDKIQIYYKEYDSTDGAKNAILPKMNLIFDGYVNSINASENKSNGIVYDIGFESTLGLSFHKRTWINIPDTFPLKDIISYGLNLTRMGNDIPFYIIADDIKDVVYKVKSSNNFKEVLEELKTKYSIQIYQTANGLFYITSPAYFYSESTFDVTQVYYNKSPLVLQEETEQQINNSTIMPSKDGVLFGWVKTGLTMLQTLGEVAYLDVIHDEWHEAAQERRMKTDVSAHSTNYYPGIQTYTKPDGTTGFESGFVSDPDAIERDKNELKQALISPVIYATMNMMIGEYDVLTNIFNIDYGDLTQNIDTVIVKGYGDVLGSCVDPIAYAMRNSLDESKDMRPTYNSVNKKWDMPDITIASNMNMEFATPTSEDVLIQTGQITPSQAADISLQEFADKVTQSKSIFEDDKDIAKIKKLIIDPDKIRAIMFNREDVKNQVDADQLAKQLLFGISKNYGIKIKTLIQPFTRIGELVIIRNSKMVAPSQRWIIKKIDTTISKNAIHSEIICYNNGFLDLPEDLIMDTHGIFNRDELNNIIKDPSSIVLED